MHFKTREESTVADKNLSSLTPNGGHPIPGHYLTEPDNISVGRVVDGDVQPQPAADTSEPDFVVLRHPWDIM